MAPKVRRLKIYHAEKQAPLRPVEGIETAITAFVGSAKKGPVNKAVRITGFAEFEQRFGGLVADAELGYAVQQFFLNGGKEARVVRVARHPSVSQVGKGLRALDRTDLFSLLALPGMSSPEIIALAADYGRQRRAFFIADPPANAVTPAELTALRPGDALTRSHVAIYHPWTKTPDPLDASRPRLTPPSGTIAGLFARTDAERGVWKAPAGAGAGLRGVTELTRRLTEAENGVLNAEGINALRSFPAAGIVAWGARTLDGADAFASEWKYVPVRRLGLYLAESVDRGTRWAVFEPNDEPLWAQLRGNVETFMARLFRDGALQGQTSRDSYFVKCDRTTTTPADIASGVVNIVIGFAPLRPAEFVVIKIQQHTA